MAPEVIACDKDDQATYDDKCDIWGMAITAIEMADMDPPLADLHPLRALYLIPSNKPPTLANAKKWSKNFNDFLKTALVKDPKKRPGATQLLKHPFLKGPTSTMKRTKHVLSELIEKVAEKQGEGAEKDEDGGSSDEEEPAVERLKIDDGSGLSRSSSNPSFTVSNFLNVVSVRKKTATRKTIVKGTNEQVFFDIPTNLMEQPQTKKPGSFDIDRGGSKGDSDGEESWDVCLLSILFLLSS